jgi:O-antigen/teichoic acid export membrane protein
MSVGISFLARAIWTLFYGNSVYGPSVLSYYIFAAFIGGIFTTLVTIIQTMKDYKGVFLSLCSGVLVKLLLNYNLIIAFRKMNLPAYYGSITATILGYLVSLVICLIILKCKFKISYENLLKNLMEIVFGTVLMIFVLFLLSLFIPIYSTSRINCIFIIIFYSIVGAVIYFVYEYKTNVIRNIFGNNIFKSIRKIIFKR